MSAWDEIGDQSEAVQALRAAAEALRADPRDPEALNAFGHAWLITGPPGSGRSTLAYAVAAELLSAGRDDAEARSVRAQVDARTHPDLTVLATEKVVISIEEIRKLVQSAQFAPSQSRFRVIVIEDADRMAERSSNVLLKSLEEPPETTIWLLCAPSEADLLPTIRSRVRAVRLRLPSVDAVARIVAERTGVDAALARTVAREAQQHIGMAVRLGKDEAARARRAATIDLALNITSVASAVAAAADLMKVAGEDAAQLTEQRDDAERAELLRTLGVEPGAPVPRAMQPQVRALEEDQKRRATRSLRDGIDRALQDLLSLYRDILMVQLSTGLELVNDAIRDRVEQAAAAATPQQTLAALDAIAEARKRIAMNVQPALAIEAMTMAFRRR